MQITQKMRQRTEEIIRALTLEEKIAMIHGAELFQTGGVDRLSIPPLKMSDGPMGVRNDFEPSQWKTLGLSDDYVTYLPCNSALASTWNRELVREIGSVLGEEARGRGKDVILAPGINIKRSPLCGRNFEYFSEDPYLTGQLAIPYIEGVQQWDVAACVKHFAANNQETQRLWVEVEVDEQTLREIYLPAFYDAIHAGGAYSLMGAYNKVYGEHCCQSQFLLTKILREEWGYEGTVISDWGAVHDTKLAASSDLDIEMSVTDDFDQYFMAAPLLGKIRDGEISEDVVNKKVRHILLLMMRLHMLDQEERKSGTYNTPEHRNNALRAARESIVLLKNEAGQLPLDSQKIKKLLVIGDNAESIHSNGGGSAEIKALYEISPIMGIKTLLGGNTEVTFARGYCRDSKEDESEINWQEKSLENGGGTVGTNQTEARKDMADSQSALRQSLRENALALAAEADQVIFIGGLCHDQDSEGNDRPDMKLPYEQDILIQELLKVRPDLTIAIIAGSPVEMGGWIDSAQSVLWGWYAGMEGGRALAEVLFGEVCPSGKLPETFYRTHEDCSAHVLGTFPGGESVSYAEGIYVGYRYQDTFGGGLQFPFGHGLSYTQFEYEEPVLEFTEEKTQKLNIRIRNTGTRAGAETVQVYAAALSPEEARAQNRPYQELVGFEKISLLPKEAATVMVEVRTPLPVQTKVLRIGSSSRDIRQTAVL